MRSNVGAGLISELLAKGRGSEGEITAAEQSLGVSLPIGLRAFVAQMDAAEGYVGDTYLAMWPIAELAELNAKARVSDFAPDLVVFATDGAGDGYAFERQTGRFVNVPMIGMAIVERRSMGDSFDAFLSSLPSSAAIEVRQPTVARAHLGLVIYEKTPFIVGGNPTDSANKVLIPLEQYAELVGWWNERLPTLVVGARGHRSGQEPQ